MSFPPSPPWAAPRPEDLPLPPPIPRRPRLHYVLGALTLLTTTLAGAINFPSGGLHERAAPLIHSAHPVGVLLGYVLFLASGLTFALCTMLFFLTHEMGHYLACRHYRVDATLPFFIPFAPLPFGTLGAVIRIRAPIPTRRALFDIGVAGPFAGFVVALVLVAAGTLGAEALPPSPLRGGALFGDSMLTRILQALLRPDTRNMELAVGPVFIAGWLGLLATAMNLIPANQLDGGHIVYALSPAWHPTVALAAGAFLVALLVTRALHYGEYTSVWTLWALIVLLFGRRHPPLLEPEPVLGAGRRVLAAAAALILVLCFMPVPLTVVP